MAPNPEFCRACLKASINQKAWQKTQDPCELLLHTASTCYLFIGPKLIKSCSRPTLQTAPALSCCWGSAPHVHSHVLVDSTSCTTCATPCSHNAVYETRSDSSPTAIANIKENSNQYTQSFYFIYFFPKDNFPHGLLAPAHGSGVVGSA